MIVNATIEAIANATDQTVLIEFYPPDQAPGTSGFDPAFADLLYAPVEGVDIGGFLPYTRMVRSIGTMRRTSAESSNEMSVTLDNLSRAVSQFEFASGFEGRIMVARLVSRELYTTYENSLILFVGRCEKPTGGSREAVTVKAYGILHSTKMTIPRRKFSATDAEGRTPDNPAFEGFPYMPQVNAGTTTYSARQKKGGLLGFLGFKKTVTKTLSYSSFSDLDASKYLPVAFGRVQLAGTHLAYSDVGTAVRMTTAFCEGPIEWFSSWRTDDVRFVISGTVGLFFARYGYPATLGPTGYEQNPVSVATWIANGTYAKTVMLFSQTVAGTSIDQVDPAPLVIIVILGQRMTLPAGDGSWTTVDPWNAAAGWSDNAAAQTRFLLTSDDYYRLDDNWLDDDSFTESYNYNNEYLWDTSFSDIIFTPGTAGFAGGDTEKNRYLLSTGVATPEYFKYLNGDASADEAFYFTPYCQDYTGQIPSGSLNPGDPVDIPDLPGGGFSDLSFYLRRRYTSNIVFTEETALVDALHKVLFVSSRLYLTQHPQTGKLRLKNKKPVDHGIATAAITTTTAALDDVSGWIGDLHGFALIDPNTANSELREVTAANYPSATHNAVTLTAPAETVVGFAGCDNASTPATATITVTTVTAGVTKTVTLDGVAFTFRPGTNDTVETCAAFIYGAINGHPNLRRRFSAAWTPGTAVVTITAKFGNLTLSSAPALSHVAPLADPGSGPVLTAPTATGSLALGSYTVGYTWVNSRGQTLMSPLTSITITAPNKRISVASVTLPSGATSVNWFCTPTINSLKLRYYKNNDGSAHTIDAADLPLLTAAIRPDTNRTGCEVIRVETAFTDRSVARSASMRSNVLRGSFKWKLGDRSKPINQVELKFRDSTQDFRLVELKLRDDVHIARTKKVNAEEFNGQAIDNWNQAYRIASGLLAELRDADFFYEWESDKEALLLEEGDVVAITDDGSEVFNLPVRIESIEYTEEGGLVKCAFTARLYTNTLYDDSVADRQIPIIVQTDQGVDYA